MDQFILFLVSPGIKFDMMTCYASETAIQVNVTFWSGSQIELFQSNRCIWRAFYNDEMIIVMISECIDY